MILFLFQMGNVLEIAMNLKRSVSSAHVTLVLRIIAQARLVTILTNAREKTMAANKTAPTLTEATTALVGRDTHLLVV